MNNSFFGKKVFAAFSFKDKGIPIMFIETIQLGS
jgi:hypothetical protein